MFKHKILTILIIILLAAACTKQAPTTKTAADAKAGNVAFVEFDVPEVITVQTRYRYEKLLWEIPDNHPNRMLLRDRLISQMVKRFERLAPEAEDARLEIYEEGLRFHAPSDFRSGQLSEALSPVAKWVVETFEPKGKEALVLSALKYLSVLEPDNAGYATRFAELLDWTQYVRRTVVGDLDKYDSMSQVLQQTVSLVPHVDLLEPYLQVLVKRQNAVVGFMQQFQAQGGTLSPAFFNVLKRGSIGSEILEAYLLGGRLIELESVVEEYDLYNGLDDELLDNIKDLANGKRLPATYFWLADIVGDQNPTAGAKACLEAIRLESDAPQYAICAGRYLSQLDKRALAIDFYARAISVDFNDSTLKEAMGLMRNAAFAKHMGSNPTNGMSDVIATVEGLLETVSEAENNDEEVRFMAGALAEAIAQIQFDNGRTLDALTLYKLSVEFWPTRARSILRQAQIYISQKQYDQADSLLTKAIEHKAASDAHGFSDYWKLRFIELRGDGLRLQGRTEEATTNYDRAVKAWAKADFPMEQAAQVAVRLGILYHWLGNNNSSNVEFKRALRISPEQRSHYAEIISFLVTQKRLSDARYFYRLAFNQDRLEPMWKVYFSVWVETLSRWTTGSSDNLAMGYLQNSAGDDWSANLSRFLTGTIDAAELRKRAHTDGHLVEADFYEAMLLLGEKRTSEAKKLFSKVLDSHLVAFFEYKMADEFLKDLSVSFSDRGEQ